MNTLLFTAELRQKRDLLVVRQRARQLAGLLGFEPAEQAGFAAAVFALACHAAGGRARVTLTFHAGPETLEVLAAAGGSRGEIPALRLVKALPGKGRGMTVADVAWAVKQLDRHTPPDLFEEVCKQNQELLQALHVLRDSRAAPAAGYPRAA